MSMIPEFHDCDQMPAFYRVMPIMTMPTSMLNNEQALLPQGTAPTKWSQSFHLDTHHFDELIVYLRINVYRGCVRIHARHEQGDKENGEVRETKRCIIIPEGVDASKVRCKMLNSHTYLVEAPRFEIQ